MSLLVMIIVADDDLELALYSLLFLNLQKPKNWVFKRVPKVSAAIITLRTLKLLFWGIILQVALIEILTTFKLRPTTLTLVISPFSLPINGNEQRVHFVDDAPAGVALHLNLKGHCERLKQWISMGFGLLIIAFILHFTDAISNKQLYSFSYVCFTAGAAGIVFSGFYILIGCLAETAILVAGMIE
ncbi:hypothetical protein HAX54_032622 [Datura stramonium]|uniref:Uncharacterized protein n=1 Tax=Datura stramonium TaxID=4076 RepID=A0ABS8VEQ0_DATST|nr:hypothetical protein [Datura stramonium]